jgi:hypothetical protein
MTRSSASADPRFNAPPRLSDLHGDARRAALVARAEAGRRQFMASYDTTNEAPARGMSETRQGLIVGWLIGFAIVTGWVLS